MEFYKTLKKAQSKFLTFWGSKTNRTTILNVKVAAGEKSKSFRVPDGTFSFEIYGVTTAPSSCEIVFPTGTVFAMANTVISEKPPLRKYFFPGVPYLERSDTFILKNTSALLITFVITYHKVIPVNT